MKKLEGKEILLSAARMNLLSNAKASHVLQEAEKLLQESIGKDFSWRIKSWKNGIIYMSAEHSVGSQKIYSASEDLLENLRERFPNYQFREIRIEVDILSAQSKTPSLLNKPI